MSEAKPRWRPNWLVIVGSAVVLVGPLFVPRAWHFSWLPLPPRFAHLAPLWALWLVGGTLLLVSYHRAKRDWARTLAILAGVASYVVHSQVAPILTEIKHPIASTVDGLSICVLIPAILLFLIRDINWS